jgi:hypothetical protein
VIHNLKLSAIPETPVMQCAMKCILPNLFPKQYAHLKIIVWIICFIHHAWKKTNKISKNVVSKNANKILDIKT